jgi:hypothetical protein
MDNELGEVIATRELSMRQRDGSRCEITVKLGKPAKFPDSDDYYAPLQIVGIGSETVLRIGGVDGFQAIQEVMKIIGAKLAAFEESAGERLTWSGDDSGLGFPKT